MTTSVGRKGKAAPGGAAAANHFATTIIGGIGADQEARRAFDEAAAAIKLFPDLRIELAALVAEIAAADADFAIRVTEAVAMARRDAGRRAVVPASLISHVDALRAWQMPPQVFLRTMSAHEIKPSPTQLKQAATGSAVMLTKDQAIKIAADGFNDAVSLLPHVSVDQVTNAYDRPKKRR